VCNLYSMTKNVEAIRRLFQVDASNDRSGNLPAMPGIYSDSRRRSFATAVWAERLRWHAGECRRRRRR
jgi:hypothetical protein